MTRPILISLMMALCLPTMGLADTVTTPASVPLQKGATLFYCNNNPDSYFVDSKGNQRALAIEVDYTDSSVTMIINPPYSVSAPGMDNSGNTNNVCFTITKN